MGDSEDTAEEIQILLAKVKLLKEALVRIAYDDVRDTQGIAEAAIVALSDMPEGRATHAQSSLPEPEPGLSSSQ